MIVRGNETVLVHGITGTQATFWSDKMKEYGTKVVGGLNPKKAGTEHLGLPVWASAADAAKEQSEPIDCSCVIVPPAAVKPSVMDAIEAGIKKIVILTEHIPVHDTMYFLSAAREAGAAVIGPNTAGHRHPWRVLCRFHARLQRARVQARQCRRDFAFRKPGHACLPEHGAGGSRHFGLCRYRRRSRDRHDDEGCAAVPRRGPENRIHRDGRRDRRRHGRGSGRIRQGR